jgi:putative transposase
MESKVNRLSGPKSPFVQCASILHFHPSARLAERNTSETPECETRRVSVAGITRHPIEGWMTQMARNISDQTSPDFSGRRYLIHDRDTRICESFRSTLTAAGVNPLRLPARSPNLNAFAERWVGSVKRECLSKMIFFGEQTLRRALAEYTEHYHAERNHQGKGNVILFPNQLPSQSRMQKQVYCRQRLAGLLKYYCRAA